jgi:hypothetical protein
MSAPAWVWDAKLGLGEKLVLAAIFHAPEPWAVRDLERMTGINRDRVVSLLHGLEAKRLIAVAASETGLRVRILPPAPERSPRAELPRASHHAAGFIQRAQGNAAPASSPLPPEKGTRP